MDLHHISEQVEHLEKLVNDLTRTMMDQYVKPKELEMEIPDPMGDLIKLNYDVSTDQVKTNVHELTKETRTTFYTLFGELKSIKTKFTTDQLKLKLSDQDFSSFTEARTLLMVWLKTGLGLSRQLEEL